MYFIRQINNSYQATKHNTSLDSAVHLPTQKSLSKPQNFLV